MTKNLIRWILLIVLVLVTIIVMVVFWNSRKGKEVLTPTEIMVVVPTIIPTIPVIPTEPAIREINYFVSPAGNDADPGSIDKPWKTIQYAVDHVLPGDTIFVRTGNYLENIQIKNSGTENAPITLTKYSLEEVVINGGGETALRASGTVAYWVVDGLTFVSTNRYTMTIGWWDDGMTDHWIVRNNKISGANFVRGAYHIWENNEINGTGYSASLGDAGISEGGESHHNIYRSNTIHDFTNKNARGIWSQGKTHDSIIEYNSISNINADGDGIRGQCIDLDGAGNIEWHHTIRGNRVSNCNYVGIQLENVFDSVVENNIVLNTKAAGIIVISYGSDVGCKVGGENNQYGNSNGDCRGKLLNTLLRQNIIVNSGDVGGIVSYSAAGVKVYSNIVYGSSVGLFLEDAAAFSNNWDVRGNIFSNNKIAEFSLIDPASFSRDEFNLLFTTDNHKPYDIRGGLATRYSLTKWQKEFSLGLGSKEGDPKFIDPAIMNFHLQPNSPAIDAGTDLGIQTDFEGKPRLSGSNFDIGPFEQKQ